MKLKDTNNPMHDILTEEVGKKVGKVHINHLHFIEGAISLHDGHYSIIQALRDAGCEIIVAEVMDIVYLGWKNIKPRAPEDNRIVRDLCLAEPKFDVDYLISNAKDVKNKPSKATKDLVAQRMLDEDYENLLQLRDPDFFRTILEWITQRGDGGFTVGTCYKDGTAVWGYKHYVKKYMNIDTIVIPPMYYQNTKYPMSGGVVYKDLPKNHKTECRDFRLNPEAEASIVIQNDLIPDGKKFVVKYIDDAMPLTELI